ncbi:MAG: GtrA family protein [Rhizobiaceae bacterium]
MSDASAKPGGVRRQLLRFGVVGIANTAIDLAAFSLLLQVIDVPLLANLLAWIVAVTFSFAANSLWTFAGERSRQVGGSLLRFVSLGALISLGVSSLNLYVLADMIGVWPAKIIGVVLAAALNFLAARWSIVGRWLA